MNSPETSHTVPVGPEFLQKRMKQIYELPVPFWQRLLGEDLHFHLGHFETDSTTPEESLKIAIHNLVSMLSQVENARFLDVGCGWGSLAIEVSRTQRLREIVCLTISRAQAEFIEAKARDRGLPLRVEVLNIENGNLSQYGTFDVFWLFEVLEHVADKRRLFRTLRDMAEENGQLAITVSCRTDRVDGPIYSQVLGIPPLDTRSDLIQDIQQSGWEIVALEDRTELTLPIWKYWLNGLEDLRHSQWEAYAGAMQNEFRELERLFSLGKLESLQLAARAV